MQITDLEHQRREKWRDPTSFNPAWADRARLAAQFITPGSSVLDVGCGPLMSLRELLPEGCTYTGADLRQWSPAVVPIDLDAGEFPSGPFDVVAMLGVVGYLRDPALALRSARKSASRLIVSFAHPTMFGARQSREAKGWINHHSPSEWRVVMRDTGWTIIGQHVHSARLRHRTVLYVAS